MFLFVSLYLLIHTCTFYMYFTISFTFFQNNVKFCVLSSISDRNNQQRGAFLKYLQKGVFFSLPYLINSAPFYLSEMIFLAEAPPSSSSSKAKKHSIRRSLKEKFTSTSQRSPLSTRNLLEDSPDPARRANLRQQGSTAQRMGVAYQKTGVRRTLAEGNQYTVQTVGRYQPVPDKENF